MKKKDDIRPGEDIRIAALDGYPLAATLFRPATPNGIAVQINPAAATPRGYYRHFAAHLASRGFGVITYDVRGMGDSGGGTPEYGGQGPDGSTIATGTLDMPAVTRELKARFPGATPVLVAHSLGGQMIGLSPSVGEFRAIQLVGSAHGYWKRWPTRARRLQMALRAYVGLPAISLFGYVPAFLTRSRRMHAIAGRETMRFIGSPHFLCDESGAALRPHNADIRCPLRHFVFTDDEVVLLGGDIDLAEFFPNATRERVVVAPGDWGMEAIRHFGFFRRSMPVERWDEVGEWLVRGARSQIATALR